MSRSQAFSRKTFELEDLSDESLKIHYRNILQRGNETITSLAKAYRRNETALNIDVYYYDSRFFGVYAERKKTGYELGISVATLPLLISLFQALFSCPFVLPELHSKRITRRYTVPFALDAKKGEINTNFAIRLTEQRALLSSLISDLCADFILLHEVGHIVCGHVESNARASGESFFAEFSGFRKRGKYLKKAWEYEADVIACMLVVQRLDWLVKSSRKHPHLRDFFVFCKDQQDLRARLIALVNVSLFALFIYLNRLGLEFGKVAYHPPPLTRASYVKDFIARRAERDWGINIQSVETFQDEYLDQFLEALENISDFDCEKIFDDFEDQLEGSRKLTQKCFQRFRSYCAKWSWIPENAWS